MIANPKSETRRRQLLSGDNSAGARPVPRSQRVRTLVGRPFLLAANSSQARHSTGNPHNAIRSGVKACLAALRPGTGCGPTAWTRLGLAVLAGLAAPLTGWAQFGAPLAAFTNCPPGVDGFNVGTVAALGSDRVLIGVTETRGVNLASAVYLFSTNGALLATGDAPAAALGQEFGSALTALGKDRVLVGAPVAPWFDPDDPTRTPPPEAWQPGAAYVFNTNGTLLATLAHPNPTPGNWDGFGAAVAAVGNDRGLIGAPNGDLWMPGHGSAYLLNANGGLLATFTRPSPTTGDYFGITVAAVGNDRLLIGAPGASAAYLFTTNGTLLRTFSPPYPTPGHYYSFGLALAAVGNDRLLIGAPTTYELGRAGAAYLFSTNGTLLTTFTHATDPTTAKWSDFGGALTAVGDDRVLIGAPWAGVAELFNTDGTLLFTFADPWTSFRQRFGSLLAAVGAEHVILGSEYGGPVYLFRAPAPVHWLGGWGNWSDAAKWSPHLPTRDDVVILPADAVVNVEVSDAEVGALTVAAGSTVNVQSGAALAVFGPLFNHGTMNLSGDVTSYASGDAVVQNGTLTINDGVAMRGMDSGGNDFAFVQTGGATTVDGTLDFGNGIIQVQGGSLNVNQKAALRGMDSGGQDLAFVQTGGSVTIDGTFETWNPSVQDGDFKIGANGNVALGNGSSFTQSGGTVSIDGALALGTLAAGGNGVVIKDGQFSVGAGGRISGSSGGGGVGFAQSGGSVRIDGMVALKGMDSGGSDVAYGQTGGTLGGSGTIDGSLIADAGVISPGASPGALIITSNFVQHAGNTLRIQIAGRTAGQFDQLRVGGSVTLGGRLEVSLLDSFAPDLGEQFPLLVCTNVSGAFSAVSAPPGFSLTNGVLPLVTGIVPTTILGPVLTGSNAVFTFGTVTNRSYTVESAAGLTATNWLFYTNLTGTGAKLHVTVPCTNAAPHRFFRVSQP
jgi:hypothetical protein